MAKNIPLRSGLTDPRLALLRERAVNPEVKTQYGLPDLDTDRRGLMRRITDPVNRGLIGATLGAPADMMNILQNLGIAAYGTAKGALGSTDLPDLVTTPTLGSEHIGEMMRKYGMVTEHRDPLLEMAAGLAPLAPKGLSMAMNATRPGRNVVRMVKGVDPTTAALEELARKVSTNERAVKVSKRGWVGPIAEGDATSVDDIANPGIFKAEELVHTHPMNADATFNPLSAGDRSSIPVSAVHAEPNGRLTAYRERLGSGQPPTFDDYVRQEDYVNELMRDPTYSTNVDPSKYKKGWLDPNDVAAYSGENLGAQIASDVSPIDRLWLDSLRGGEAATGDVQVIKPKGGNWMKYSQSGDIVTDPEHTAYMISVLEPDELSKWSNTQLKKYMVNDLATEGDPIRALAERGISHVPDKEVFINGSQRIPDDVPRLRKRAGFSPEPIGQSDLAKAWENVADSNIDIRRAGDNQFTNFPNAKLDNNPWLAKVDPDSSVYGFIHRAHETADNLGFQHLIDELRNATNPNSTLPPELTMKYSSLDRLSVPQAVERVHKINEWRAANIAEENAKLANNAATVLHKEYPDVGMKWMQLRAPEGTDPHTYLGEGKYTDPNMNSLKDALKYEGDTMGHCVGGYCDRVADGSTNIFSLRDEKGRPHVTIETRPGSEQAIKALADPGWQEAIAPEQLAELQRQAAPQIVQIKGKGNAKPADKYLPMVQDFIRSQQWGKVGDFGNTGLFKGDDLINDTMHPLRTRLINNLQEQHPDLRLTNSDLSSILKGKYYATPEEVMQDVLSKVNPRQE